MLYSTLIPIIYVITLHEAIKSSSTHSNFCDRWCHGTFILCAMIIITSQTWKAARLYFIMKEPWNSNIFISTKFTSLSALEVVILTTSGTVNDRGFVQIITFPFRWRQGNLIQRSYQMHDLFKTLTISLHEHISYGYAFIDACTQTHHISAYNPWSTYIYYLIYNSMSARLLFGDCKMTMFLTHYCMSVGWQLQMRHNMPQSRFLYHPCLDSQCGKYKSRNYFG